jgi:hypothetical protein
MKSRLEQISFSLSVDSQGARKAEKECFAAAAMRRSLAKCIRATIDSNRLSDVA